MFDGKKAKGPFIAKFNTNGEIQWIDDADSREKTWNTTVKVKIIYPGGIAINATEDFLYTTGNSVKTSSKHSETSTHYITETITEMLLSISKVKTD